MERTDHRFGFFRRRLLNAVTPAHFFQPGEIQSAASPPSHKFHNRFAVAGDDDPLAGFRRANEFGKASFGLAQSKLQNQTPFAPLILHL